MSAAKIDFLDEERDLPPYPAVCDFCGRFVAWKDARLIHEFGDYGSILSTEIECPACASPAGSGCAEEQNT